MVEQSAAAGGLKVPTRQQKASEAEDQKRVAVQSLAQFVTGTEKYAGSIG